MNIYHPYSSFAHMVRDLKEIMEQERELMEQERSAFFPPGDLRAAMVDFMEPVFTLCHKLKRKYAQETGLCFETLVDQFEDAFDEGYYSLSFDQEYLTDCIGINPRKASQAVMIIIENLEFIKLIQCTRQPESNDHNPVFIFEITELFSALTGLYPPSQQYLLDDENHSEENDPSEQRVLH